MSASNPRGTSNSNVRGNTAQRRARRTLLIADWSVPFLGTRITFCVFCDEVVDERTVSADRIIPGKVGGTYVRGNMRPSCLHCNSVEGNRLRHLLASGHDFFDRTFPATRVSIPRSGRLLPGQRITATALVLDGRLNSARIAREIGCSPDTVARIRKEIHRGTLKP